MSDAQQQRYAAIERHYSQGQWQEVLSGSTALLAELPEQAGEPLRTQLILLQGHTQLYGLGQVAAAAAIYRQVLDSQAEPLLLSIARQELQRCMEHLAARQSVPDLAAAQQSQPASAMPWLDALGGVDPAAAVGTQDPDAQPPWLTKVIQVTDVIDEPDQLEVHQADPQRDEVVNLAPVEAQALSEPVAVAQKQQSPVPLLSSAEDAELARGLLTVVLR